MKCLNWFCNNSINYLHLHIQLKRRIMMDLENYIIFNFIYVSIPLTKVESEFHIITMHNWTSFWFNILLPFCSYLFFFETRISHFQTRILIELNLSLCLHFYCYHRCISREKIIILVCERMLIEKQVQMKLYFIFITLCLVIGVCKAWDYL
jgi:hypothetical protein